jgi:hypothetical protein
MSLVDRRQGAGPERDRHIAVFLAVVLALGAIGACQPLHLHSGDTPGLFNEEHILAALDSITGDVPLSGHGPADGLELARSKAQLPDSPRPDRAIARHVGSRAPPRVSSAQ